jgi:hypothetical protein
MVDLELDADAQAMLEYLAAVQDLIRMELSAGMKRYAMLAMQDDRDVV